MDKSLVAEALKQLCSLVEAELIKLNSIEAQIKFLDGGVERIHKYKQRITYRGFDEEKLSVETCQNKKLETDLQDLPSADDVEYASETIAETQAYHEDIGTNWSEDPGEYINREEKEKEDSEENVSSGQETLFVPIGISDCLSERSETIIQVPLPTIEQPMDEIIDWSSHYHMNQGEHVCNYCHKPYRLLSQTKEHLRDSHGVGAVVLECEQHDCSYTTHSGAQMRAHRSWHANNGALKCSICHKEYLGGTKGLRNHMKIHSVDRNYECSECGKQFINLSRLNFHIQNVHGEATYFCELCSKSFRSKANLLRHQRIHSDEKAYKCPYCTFCTAGSTSLNTHVRCVHKVHDFTSGQADKLKKKAARRKEPLVKSPNSHSIVTKGRESLLKINA
eukprot:TRINITY_DN3074_c0_g1_i1.p1 TRINITY_DN3074_c0_g1~~TRINITY_DN3074_c0_g1_i1.p1  ORF type:complete len:392 (+),score=29.20 TRINITY_DN3074_c0_g1_i1:68-1243(+)